MNDNDPDPHYNPEGTIKWIVLAVAAALVLAGWVIVIGVSLRNF